MTDTIDRFEAPCTGTILRRAIEERLPHPKIATSRKAARPISRLLVLIKGENPTFSYYIENRLLRESSIPYIVRSIDHDGLDDIEPEGLFVIVCRYIRTSQLSWLTRNATHLAGVALLIDDDIAALVSGKDGSWTYRAYLAYFGLLPLPRLNRLLTHIWASTRPLQKRLSSDGDEVALVSPSPVLADHLPRNVTAASKTLRIAFHATDVHSGEHNFLLPIVKEVLQRCPNVSFEVRARGRNRRLWKTAGIEPRQLQLQPLTNWPQYHAETKSAHADIFLVPLLDTAVNAVRADTKRVDCCRLGAAAVFSSCEVYGGRRRNGELHVGSSISHWVEAIVSLVHNKDLRSTAAAATRSTVVDMSNEGENGFPF